MHDRRHAIDPCHALNSEQRGDRFFWYGLTYLLGIATDVLVRMFFMGVTG